MEMVYQYLEENLPECIIWVARLVTNTLAHTWEVILMMNGLMPILVFLLILEP